MGILQLHTPGPYRAFGSAIYADKPQDVDHRQFRGFDKPEDGKGYLIAESIPHKPTRDLLTAAPILLDACIRAEWWLDTLPEGHAMRDVLRVAILAARGEQ
jgi:hypothetical protein